MPLLRRLLRSRTVIFVFLIIVAALGLFLHSRTSAVSISSISKPQYPFHQAFTSSTRENVKPAHERALVVAATQHEDIRWTKFWMSDSAWKTFVYMVDDPEAVNKVPENKGREAMVYLTYIIDRYHNLANVSIFMHATRYGWHNDDFIYKDSIEMVNRLNPLKIQRDGYMNLRCLHDPGCPAHIHPLANVSDLDARPEEPHVAGAWQEMFPGTPVPETLAQPCCSQFAVSSDSIRSRPLEQYIHIRKWILSTPIHDKILGRIMEYVWQYLFAGNYVLCPDELDCYCEGYDACFLDIDEKDAWYNLYEQYRLVRAKGEGLMGADEAAMARKKAWADASRSLLAQLNEKRDLVFLRTYRDKVNGELQT